MYRNAGININEIANDETIVVNINTPNLFSESVSQNIRKTPEKQEVRAPPKMVYPIDLYA